MGAYRWAFNNTVAHKEAAYTDNGKTVSYFKYRKELMDNWRLESPWINEIPAHIIYGAMMDADKAYMLIVKTRSKGLVSKTPFCRKKTQRSFYMLGNAVTHKGMYPRKLGLLKSKESIPHKPSDCRVILENNKWYLSYPFKVKRMTRENQARVCAIDPGVRTFATVLGTDGVHKLGDAQVGRLVRLGYHLDDLYSRMAKETGRKKRAMRKAARRMIAKIKSLVADMHYQVIGWLMRNYDCIVFPDASFTGACQKGKRKISSKVVRSLLTWSFATFRDRLNHKCKLNGVNLIIVNESYTSKTANWTGEIASKLGGRKTISSKGVTMDRDTNGALGIFLKALVDHPVQTYRYY